MSEEKNVLEELYDFRQFLKWFLKKEMWLELTELAELIDKSYVDAHHRISEQSEYGGNCGYAIKARNLFLAFQQRPIRDKIVYIYETFCKEGDINKNGTEK